MGTLSFQRFGNGTGQIIIYEILPAGVEISKNNLNSNRHGYTFDNVPISLGKIFLLFKRIETKAIRLFVLGNERVKKGL